MKNHASSRGMRQCRRLPVRLRIEPLEDRTLLAAAVAALFDPVQVNVGINHVSAESTPEVGVAADGSFNVAFLQALPGGGSTRELYVRRFDADGTPKALNTVLVASGTVADPQIAVREDGSFIVAYVSEGAGVSTIFIGLYAADGAKLAGPKRVAAGIEPDVAVRNSDGSFVVAWVGNPTGHPADYGVYAQGFDANGAALAPAFPVATSIGVGFLSPSVAIRLGSVPTGETSLLISYVNELAIFNDILVQRYSDLTGTSIGDLIHVNISQGYQGQAAVAIDTAGKFVVTWAYGDGVDSFVRFRTYDKDGNALNADEKHVDGVGYGNTPGNETSPAVAIADDGQFIITYVEGVTYIGFQQYRGAGIPVAGEHGFGGKGTNTSIGTNASGTFVMAADADVTVQNKPLEPYVRAFRQIPRAFFAVSAGGVIEVRNLKDNLVVASKSDPLAGRFQPFGAAYVGGISAAFGDVTGDGYDDLIVGAVDAGLPVRVYGGSAFANGFGFSYFDSSFSKISGFIAGTFVAAGDVNADGYSDILTSSGKGNPHVRIWDGHGFANPSYNLLANFFAYQTGFNVGASIAAGDLNDDGYAELVTGALPGNPHVRVFDGKAIALGPFNFDPATNPSANQLASPNFFPFGLNFDVGAYVAIGDIYGDGGDLIVGASRGNPDVRVYKNADVLNPAFNPQVDPPATSFFANTLNKDIGAPVAAVKLHGEAEPADILVGETNGPVIWRVVKGTTNGGPIPPPPVEVNGVKFEGAFFGIDSGSVFVGG